MSPFLQTVRALPKPFWVLAGATFVNRFGVFVWPFLTLFITSQGNSEREAGYAIAAYSAGSLCAAWIGGWIADRFGRNAAMGASSIGGAVCMLAMSQASSWQALAVLAMLTGFVADAGNPATNALVQDIVPEGQRVAAFAVLRFAVNLGWSLGPAAAGFLADQSFFWLFAVDAATSAIFGIVAWMALPRGRNAPRASAGWRPALASIRANRAFLALFFACFFLSWNFRQSSSTFVLQLEHAGHSKSWTGLILALNGLMVCTLELPLAAATSRVATRAMLAIGYFGMGAAFLVLIGGSSLGAFTLCIVLFTLGEMCAFSRQQAYAASLAPDEMRGRYSGFLSLAWGVGGIVSSIIGLRVYEASPEAVWIICAVFGSVAAMLMLFGSGRERR
jgi:MFS family permease